MVGVDEAVMISKGDQSKGREAIEDILEDDDGANSLTN